MLHAKAGSHLTQSQPEKNRSGQWRQRESHSSRLIHLACLKHPPTWNDMPFGSTAFSNYSPKKPVIVRISN